VCSSTPPSRTRAASTAWRSPRHCTSRSRSAGPAAMPRWSGFTAVYMAAGGAIASSRSSRRRSSVDTSSSPGYRGSAGSAPRTTARSITAARNSMTWPRRSST
jgi:hypothetical protein